MPTSFTDEQRKAAVNKFLEIAPTAYDEETLVKAFLDAKGLDGTQTNSARTVVRTLRNYIEKERVSEFATRARRNGVGLTEMLVEYLLEQAGQPVQARVVATLRPVIYISPPSDGHSNVRVRTIREMNESLVTELKNWAHRWMEQEECPGAWVRDALVQSGFDESKFESIFA